MTCASVWKVRNVKATLNATDKHRHKLFYGKVPGSMSLVADLQLLEP